MNIAMFNVPEISAHSTTLGISYATSFAVNKLSGLLDKINPINKLTKTFDDANNSNVQVYQDNVKELEHLDREIANLQRMKANQQS